MDTKAAKDYLVQQTVEQAALEHVPLTDLETRMMYFTESDPASCDDPFALNDEFEQEYDTAEYEAKMSRLLHHAQRDPPRVVGLLVTGAFPAIYRLLSARLNGETKEDKAPNMDSLSRR